MGFKMKGAPYKKGSPAKFIGALIGAASQTLSKSDKDLIKKHKITTKKDLQHKIDKLSKG